MQPVARKQPTIGSYLMPHSKLPVDDGLATLFAMTAAAAAPPALRSFARQSMQKYRSADGAGVAERRLQARHYQCLEAEGIPIDSGRRPVAEPIACVTRDLSRGGVALVLPRMISSNLLALQFRGRDGSAVHNVVEVLRCRPAGMFFEAAGPFVGLLSDNDLSRVLGFVDADSQTLADGQANRPGDSGNLKLGPT